MPPAVPRSACCMRTPAGDNTPSLVVAEIFVFASQSNGMRSIIGGALVVAISVLAIVMAAIDVRGGREGLDQPQAPAACSSDPAVRAAANAGMISALSQQVATIQALASKTQGAYSLLESTTASQAKKLTALEQQMATMQSTLQNGAAMQQAKVDHATKQLDGLM